MPSSRRCPVCTLLLTLTLLVFVSGCAPAPTPPPANTATDDPTITPTASEAPTQTPYIIIATPENGGRPAPSGLFFLSIAENGRYHLFGYDPQSLPLTRLSAGDWDDVAPALSPDGGRLAFASRRNAYWDLYLLDLANGDLLRLTDTPEYDAAPSWSPDGAFIVHETYLDGSLELLIRSASDPEQAPIRLTNSPASDSSPAWSPLGRQIAFVSNRSGEPEIWIADLDRAGEERYINVSRDPEKVQSRPAWSPDGNHLAWAVSDPASGLTGIYVWDARSPDAPARLVTSGDWPIWLDDTRIASRISTPNQVFLAGYDLASGMLVLPPVLLPGPLQGLTYGNTSRPIPGPFASAALYTPEALYLPRPNPLPDIPGGRAALVRVEGIQAPYPQLHELADDPFQALRSRMVFETGWDALSSLENAYIPITVPLDPGLGDSWLYTGRAFTLNPALIQAGWMVVVREDFGQQTYWRIYLHTAAQDGSQGAPLQQIPWDFAARSGSPAAYESGGRLMDPVPEGYWFDLTALAIQYGWERLPALTNWRTYYTGARFNELAYTAGLDWRAAMLQLYPPEALVTPTVVIPPTRTPTRTPPWYRSPTPTSTPTPRPTSTP